MRNAAGDLPAGKGLDDCERALLRGECLEHNAFQALVVLGDDEVTETPPHFRLHRRKLYLDVAQVGAPYRELGFDLRVMRAEAELDAAVRDQFLDSGEQLVDMRFAETIGMKALQMDRRWRAATREHARDDLFFEHAAQFARHAGCEKEPRLADV